MQNELYWDIIHKIIGIRWKLYLKFSDWAYPHRKEDHISYDPKPLKINNIYNEITTFIDRWAYQLDDLMFVVGNIIKYYFLSSKKHHICKTCISYTKKRCLLNHFNLSEEDRISYRLPFWNCGEHVLGVAFRSPRGW